MHFSDFTMIGKILRIDHIEQTLRVILSDAGPVKAKGSADIRDPELIKVITQPNGFKPGDTVVLSGRTVLDEATGLNMNIVDKAGASRIATTPSTTPLAAVPPAIKNPVTAADPPAIKTQPLNDLTDVDLDIPF